MAYLYQAIMNVPGLSGSTYQRQKQLYERLGSPNGPYTGSYNQNIMLLNNINKGNYGQQAAAAPSQPVQKTAAQIEAENKAALAKEYARQTGLYGELTKKQKDYSTQWGYDDVQAAGDADRLNSFMDQIQNVNTNAYSYDNVGPNWDELGAQINSGDLAVNGVGKEFLKQLAISGKLYQDQWQREVNRMKEDQLVQEQSANQQYGQRADELSSQYGVNGIRGGLQNAAYTTAQNAAGSAFQQQAREKQRWLEDWKRQQKESLVGYAQNTRNAKIDQYNKQSAAESGITDKGLIDQALNFSNTLKYN